MYIYININMNINISCHGDSSMNTYAMVVVGTTSLKDLLLRAPHEGFVAVSSS